MARTLEDTPTPPRGTTRREPETLVDSRNSAVRVPASVGVNAIQRVHDSSSRNAAEHVGGTASIGMSPGRDPIAKSAASGPAMTGALRLTRSAPRIEIVTGATVEVVLTSRSANDTEPGEACNRTSTPSPCNGISSREENASLSIRSRPVCGPEAEPLTDSGANPTCTTQWARGSSVAPQNDANGN